MLPDLRKESLNTMLHRNAPLTIEGRRRLIERCQTRPIAHVAAEMGISRACASKWVNRFRRYGELGLQDRSSSPRRQPTATATDAIIAIEELRRTRKWSATRISFELNELGSKISRRTVSRYLVALGLNRRRFIDPAGETNRVPRPILARRPGHMVHVDVKKVGRIPDGGGWRIHGKGSAQAKAVASATKAGNRAGCSGHAANTPTPTVPPFQPSSTTAPPVNRAPQPAPVAPRPGGSSPQIAPSACPNHDDDPAGSPCTDQSGAQGTYTWSDDSNQWVCQITGDATTPPEQRGQDDDPAGHPRTDQSGLPGTYIWSDDTEQWVCQIS